MMKNKANPFRMLESKVPLLHSGWLIMSAIILLITTPAIGDWTITQTIDLKVGWNAIYVEIEPSDPDPDVLFAGTPVTQVLTYFPKNSPVTFIQDPNEKIWKTEGWNYWIPPDKHAALMKSLYAIQANQAYLLYSTANYDLQITGEPKFRNQTWEPDSFNLKGFHVNPNFLPSFFQYFDGSKAHTDYHIYYLVNNQWIKLSNPQGENIASGAAYWVYCKGGSVYPGPMELNLPGTGDALNFIAAATELEIEVINHSPNPLSFTLEPVQGNEQAVPLSLVKENVTQSQDPIVTYEKFTTYTPKTPLEAGEKHRIRLGVRRSELVADETKSLLKISDDIGTIFYIPVSAEKIKSNE